MTEEVMTVIQETEILGRRINLYRSINNPLFLAKDVAEWIDYQFISGKKVRNTSKMLKLVDDDEKVKAVLGIPIKDTPSGHGGFRKNTEMWFLTEDGLYEVCMLSRKPIAKQMKREIKSYLKSIRFTGAVIQEGLEEEIVNEYFPSFSRETKLKMIDDIIKQNRMLKISYDDSASMGCDGSVLIGDFAELLRQSGVQIDENQLFQWLRDNGYFVKSDRFSNMPAQKYIDQDLFEIVEKVIYNPDESVTTIYTPMVTQKGQVYLGNLFKQGNNQSIDCNCRKR